MSKPIYIGITQNPPKIVSIGETIDGMKMVDILLDNENKEILKPYIEKELGKLYFNFNKNQKKDERNIKENIKEKINEYKEYRNSECTLDNGYTPPIINGIIN